MWLARDNSEKRDTTNQLVAVAIDRDKGSQQALKWAIDNVLQRGQTVVLLHVKLRHQASSNAQARQLDRQTKDLFFPFRCFCTRKDIQCRDVVLEDTDVPKALLEFVNQQAVEVLIVGASSKGSFLRFSKMDTPAIISKGAPDFCTVYTITKGGKVSSMRSASRSAPSYDLLHNQIMNQPSGSEKTPSTSRLGPRHSTNTPGKLSGSRWRPPLEILLPLCLGFVMLGLGFNHRRTQILKALP